MSRHEVYALLAIDPQPPVRLRPGDWVGRLRTAALRIDDPRVSEAHAYMSLRDGSLKLLALRGGMAIDGRMVREATLEQGLEIALAQGLSVRVVEVAHPATVLALEGPGIGRVVLTGRAQALRATPDPQLVVGTFADAALQLWTDGGGWMGRAEDGLAEPLAAGHTFATPWGSYAVVEVETAHAHISPTQVGGGLAEPIRLEGYFDTVHVHRRGVPPFVLAGAPARLLYELGTIGQPVRWREVAGVLWPDDGDEQRVRKRWDVLMVRLRRRLTDAHIRTSLVQADGLGNVSLMLESHDEFVDCG